MKNVQNEIRIYGLLLTVMILSCFVTVSIIFNKKVKALRCGNSSNENISLTANYTLQIETVNIPVESFEVSVRRPIVKAKIGQDISLICSGNMDKLFCHFTSPDGKKYTMNSKFDSARDGAITPAWNDWTHDCGVYISRVRLSHFGLWRCNITSKSGDQWIKGNNQIQLKEDD